MTVSYLVQVERMNRFSKLAVIAQYFRCNVGRSLFSFRVVFMYIVVELHVRVVSTAATRSHG